MSIEIDYIPFTVRNFTGKESTSGYAVDICPFTFIPKINTEIYSDKRILWDFGDKTTSTSLCATHAYLFPGKYIVSLFVYDGEGDGITSSFTTEINVENFVTDTLLLSSESNYIIEAGSLSDRIDITRYNSWQSYNALSGDNYTITLHASGANGSFFDFVDYNSSKYSHLDLSYKFFKRDFNPKTQLYTYTPIDLVKTSNNDTLYAKVSGDNLVLCDPGDEGSALIGTKGTASIYFASDSYSINNDWFRDRLPVLVSIGFDTSNFDDYISSINGYTQIIKSNRFAYLNSITRSTGFTVVPQLSLTNLTFSPNGLDGLGDESAIFTFDQTQYADTNIPVTVRVKSAGNYPAKYLPLLSATDTVTSDFQIKIIALSGDGIIIPSTLQPAISTKYHRDDIVDGGYWKGYIYFKNQNLSNVYLSAYATVNESYNFLKYPTPLGVIFDNESNIQQLNFIQKYNSDNVLELSLDNRNIFTSNLSPTSGINCIQVLPVDSGNISELAYEYWVADYHKNYLSRYKTDGTLLSSIDVSLLRYPNDTTVSLTNPQPYWIASNSAQDLWVTLKNGISAVKLSGSTGRILSLAAPNLPNNTYTIPISLISYPGLSAFKGLNTVLPGSIDTDANDNIWVTYMNPASGYIFKYSTSGAILSSISLTAGYSPVELVVGTDSNVWAIAQHQYTTNTDISAFNDIVIHHNDITGITTSVYATTGRAGNITLDTNNNAYITVGNSSVVKILSADFTSTVIPIEAATTTTASSAQHLKGIGSTASKEIIVVNTASDKINVIDSISDINSNNYQYILGDYKTQGDWTGFKWISKYSPRTFTVSATLTGTSSQFNVYEVADRYRIGKFGEDFDATQLYKDLRYQEALLYYDNIFDNFIGTIVGNISSSPNTLGKRVYEKAQNFPSNTIDPNTCNVDALYSLCKMFDIDVSQFDRYKFSTPANIKRLIDILSIKQSKLWGTRNKFNRDFDTYGYEPGVNEFYGRNSGRELNVQYTILTAGSASRPIVAQSKFSNDFTYINTDILSSQYIEYIDGTETYHMSAFNTNWGWPLVLPQNATYEDLKQNYRFFEYIDFYENTQFDGIINWDDIITLLPETLSSRNTWIGKNGVVDEMIKFTLFDGLSLFNTVDAE
jgi:hypothetical protein